MLKSLRASILSIICLAVVYLYFTSIPLYVDKDVFEELKQPKEEKRGEDVQLFQTENPVHHGSMEKRGRKTKFKVDQVRVQSRGLKRILFWNDFYGSKNYGFCCGRNPFKKAGCPVSNCQTTKSRDENLRGIDAVVFHQRTLVKDDLPSERFPWQYYVFVSLESPSYGNIPYYQWNNFFNISMTYRSDSDIYMPYGRLEKFVSTTSQPEFNMTSLTKKTGFAAWFVSHCQTNSKREDIVKKLAKYLPKNSIQIFGGCGPRKCVEKERCWKMVSNEYKFYLSLENSICKDYVTEKLFEALKHNVIPVVLGGANYSSILPPQSYIDIQDFPSIQSLGKYLLYLDSNPEEYLKYFSWKTTFTVRNSDADFRQAFCRLCEYLNRNPGNQRTKNPRVISDLTDWWVNQSNCDSNIPVIL